MRLLFITRKFPPMVGGMEKVSYALATEFSKKTDTTIISWGRSQKFLPFFLPLAFIKSVYYILTKQITNVHLGDALLSPLGLVLKMLFGVKVSVTVHGLDITYKLSIYQKLIPFCVSRLDKVICISSATYKECISRSIPKKITTIIPNGVYPEEFQTKANRRDLETISGISLTNKKVLITVGRLVRRKGVYWFIKNIYSKLNTHYVYLIIGDGPEKVRIQQLIESLNISKRTKLLGRVSDRDLKIIYNTADLFIMPNIKVKGDMEGFGLVAIEAGSAGLPVLTTKTEGLRDVIRENVNGIFLPLQQFGVWQEKINEVCVEKCFTKKTLISWITRQYNWHNIVSKYIYEIK